MKHFSASPATWLALAALPLLVAAPPCLGEDAPTPPQPSTMPSPWEGMVYVDVTGAKIGTTAEEALKLAGNRKEVIQILLYETPVHDPKLVPYLLDKYEVTNAQYHKFLEDTGRITVFKTGSAAFGNLAEVARHFAHEGRETEAAKHDQWSWGQIYELNKDALQAALPDLKGQKEKFRLAALPPDIMLKVYRWRLPQTWFLTSGKLEGNGAPDHPVRDVTYLEAEAFAEWAGKHVMTEAEYEWAARGPDGRPYPWGTEWMEKIDEATGERVVERRCNWADLKVVDAAQKPTTVAVTALPEGQSWCGAFHLLGNVAEWTSTWFDPYPGWTGSVDPAANFYQSYHGNFARVIRGASCADRERVVLRCAYRDFVGGGRMKPPKPDHSFENVGFRCAAYLTPARDRLQSTIARVLRPKKVRPEHLATDRFAGSAALRLTPAGAAVENQVYVTGRSHAILVVPVQRLFPTDDKHRAPAKSVAELLKVNPQEFDPPQEAVVLGVFRTDVPLKVMVVDPKYVPAEAPGSGRRDRKKAEVEVPLVPGTLEPDTYVLGLARGGQLGFYRSNLDFVAYLDSKADFRDVKSKKGEAAPASTMTVDADADLVTTSFFFAFGGRGMTDDVGATVKFAVEGETGALESAGSWR